MTADMKISIITPTRNSAETLRETIDSVLGQSGPFELEYIIVDSLSTDGTADIARSYGNRLTFISEHDSGPHDAIHKGISRSSGEIVAWLGGDDLHFPWTLTMVAGIFRDLPEVEWIGSTISTLIDSAGTIFGVNRLPPYSRDAFLDGLYIGTTMHTPFAMNFIPAEACFYRRRLFDRIDHDAWVPLRFAGDFALWSRFFLEAELVAVDAPLGAYRTRAGQNSASMQPYLSEAFGVLDHMRADWGYTGRTDADAPYRLYSGVKAVKSDPLDPASLWRRDDVPFVVLSDPEMKRYAWRGLLG